MKKGWGMVSFILFCIGLVLFVFGLIIGIIHVVYAKEINTLHTLLLATIALLAMTAALLKT